MGNVSEAEDWTEEASKRTDVRSAEIHNLALEGEWLGDSTKWGVLIVFEPEVTELYIDFRKWLRSPRLHIRQIRILEERGKVTALHLSKRRAVS